MQSDLLPATAFEGTGVTGIFSDGGDVIRGRLMVADEVRKDLAVGPFNLYDALGEKPRPALTAV